MSNKSIPGIVIILLLSISIPGASKGQNSTGKTIQLKTNPVEVGKRITNPDSYAETSSTGMFIYALASGIDNGWLPKEKYMPNVVKGWEALAGYVNKKGKTRNVCIATNAKNSERHYLKRWKLTGDYHGQAAVLWAATAMESLQKRGNHESKKISISDTWYHSNYAAN